MATKPSITTIPKRFRSGAVVVEYTAGRVRGVVFFDHHGRYSDATRQTRSSTNGRGFCEARELPAGVLAAARDAAFGSVA